jgi:hypothetical protein
VDKTVSVNVRIPELTRRELKTLAAQQGSTIQKLILGSIAELLQREKLLHQTNSGLRQQHQTTEHKA